RSGDDALIKEKNLDEKEAAAERVMVPTAVEVATATVSIPAGSDVVPTASPIFATATIVTLYIRQKGKEKMVETDTPKKKKFQEQIDIQMARQLEEEMERDAQRMNEQIARNAEASEEVPEEKVKEMMQLVPIEEVYEEALQVKHPIID
nr:hypothetical protein [Tanacetum cinerariifolium]